MDTLVMEHTSCARLTPDERAALDALVRGGLLPPPRRGSVGLRGPGGDPLEELQGELDDGVGVVIQGRHVVAVR